MFLIYKSWYDSLTSMREPDFGYDPVGYVDTKEEAESIVNTGGNDPHYYNEEPRFKFEEVKYFEGGQSMAYMLGQRVILNGSEIGTVVPSETGTTSFGIWVFSPSKKYASDYALTSVKPLPNGQL